MSSCHACSMEAFTNAPVASSSQPPQQGYGCQKQPAQVCMYTAQGEISCPAAAGDASKSAPAPQTYTNMTAFRST